MNTQEMTAEEKRQVALALLRDPDVHLELFTEEDGVGSVDELDGLSACMNGDAISIELMQYVDLNLTDEEFEFVKFWAEHDADTYTDTNPDSDESDPDYRVMLDLIELLDMDGPGSQRWTIHQFNYVSGVVQWRAPFIRGFTDEELEDDPGYAAEAEAEALRTLQPKVDDIANKLSD